MYIYIPYFYSYAFMQMATYNEEKGQNNIKSDKDVVFFFCLLYDRLANFYEVIEAIEFLKFLNRTIEKRRL